jgi:hypothetical protein
VSVAWKLRPGTRNQTESPLLSVPFQKYSDELSKMFCIAKRRAVGRHTRALATFRDSSA